LFVNRESCLQRSHSITNTSKKVINMNDPMISPPNAASFLRTREPPNMIPNPAIAITVIAVRKAAVVALPNAWDRSRKLAPHRLQKLSPCVIGLPQVEQYMAVFLSG
jgi:hypothetical protein